MSKITSLQAGLDRAASNRAAAIAPAAPPPDLDTLPDTKQAKSPGRAGKVHVGAYLPDGFRRSMRLVQAQTGEDTQTLLARALNDLFKAHNVPVVDQE